MTAQTLTGQVVVVAGDDRILTALTGALAGAGAVVAVVATHRRSRRAALQFRADPADAPGLGRIAAHVEQRLGPIDRVMCDRGAAQAAAAVFDADLRRRGRPTVVVVDPAADADDVVSRLVDMP